MAMNHPDPVQGLELEWVERTLTLKITAATDDLAEAMFDRLRRHLLAGHLRVGPFVLGDPSRVEEVPS